MPHMPAFVEAGPMGACCPYCGPLAPVFTCMQCGVMQMMYVSGAGFAPQLMPTSGPSTVAPAVEAPQGASGSHLSKLLIEAGGKFLTEFAGQMGNGFGKDASQWASSWFGDNSWSGNGNYGFGGGGQSW